MANIKKAAGITAEDFLSDAAIMLSVFIRDPQFQGQTKDKLTSTKAAGLVEKAVKDSFDHWLSSDKENASALIEYVISRAELRKKEKKKKCKTANRRQRNCVCRGNWQTAPKQQPRIRKYLLSRATLQGDPPSRDATV